MIEKYFVEVIRKILGKNIKNISILEYKEGNGEALTISIRVVDSEKVLELLEILKEKFTYNQLMDIFCVDYPKRYKRFELNYRLQSLLFNNAILIKMSIELGKVVPSVTKLFKSANWLEREVWDMYGILFKEHPDLRRILTDYGFEGFPLRKDFPLSGYMEVSYDDEVKKVVLEPLELGQEMREFKFTSPWEKIRE